MAKNMKRIHSVKIHHLNDDSEPGIGIVARAEVQLRLDNPKDDKGSFVVQQITSGGLWGIEGGCDCNVRSWYGDHHDTACPAPGYYQEIEREQLQELAEQLHAIGFSNRAVRAAFKNVEGRTV